MKQSIFVSYAHKDKARVKPIVRKLSELGFNTWLDIQSIRGGEFWSVEIAQAISKCNFFILFISKFSMKSDFVRREVDLALRKKRKIIPVRLDDTDIPDEFSYQTSGIQWIEVKDSNWMSRLLVTLGSDYNPVSLPSPDELTETNPGKRTDSGVSIGGNVKNSVIVVGNGNSINQKGNIRK